MLDKKTFLAGAAAGAVIAASAGALAITGVSAMDQAPQGRAVQAQDARLIRTGQPVFAPPPGAPLSFADIIERVSPAVVSIETRGRVDASVLRGIPGFENFPFNFGPNGQGGQGGQAPNPEDLPETRGAGSGFFISADGYIVTNNHVIQGADEITVKLSDDRELRATVVGRDEDTDMAVLKVEGRDFPFVEFETQARPRVGDWVIAVGNPFGYAGTATAGIVSAQGRDIGEAYVDYLQIDAPINRGNSGGPTFDIYGRVIGINTAIITPTGAYAGIGFAIPADVADQVSRQLIRGGRVERGYIGVTIVDLTDELAEAQGLTLKDGAIVTDVVAGGPAARAGVQPGDVVTHINGDRITSNTDLTRRVGRVRAGETIRLTILRNGQTVNLNLQSGTRPSLAELNRQNEQGGPNRPSTPDAPAKAPGAPVLGMNLAPLDDAARRQFGIEASVRGAVVTNIERSSQAARVGLQPGDVIVRADNRPISNAAELQSIVATLTRANRPSILLLVNRDGRNVPVPLPLK